jgi:hypothetical protein
MGKKSKSAQDDIEAALEDLEVRAIGRNRGPNEYLRKEQESFIKHYEDHMKDMDQKSLWNLESGYVLHEDPLFVEEARRVSFIIRKL